MRREDRVPQQEGDSQQHDTNPTSDAAQTNLATGIPQGSERDVRQQGDDQDYDPPRYPVGSFTTPDQPQEDAYRDTHNYQERPPVLPGNLLPTLPLFYCLTCSEVAPQG